MKLKKNIFVKRMFTTFLAVAMCVSMGVNAFANNTNLVEPEVKMPNAPALVTVPEDHQRIIAEAEGIELLKEVPDDFVKPRAASATMTSKYDQRVVRLVITFEGTSSKKYGTGFMIGADSVATAAHNLNHPTYGKATSITGYIGATSASSCVSSFTISNTSKFLRPEKWDSTKGYRYDYGVIKLNSDVTAVGYFGFGAYSDSVLSSNAFNLIGYGTNTYQSGAESDLSNIGTYDFYYTINTRGGDSGAPVFYGSGSVAGIHAYGPQTSDGLPSATRITSAVFADLKEWKYQ